MRIWGIRVYLHDLDVVEGPYVYSGGALDTIQTVLVAIDFDNGLTGWGETCPLGPTYQPAFAAGAVAALRHLAPHLLGAPASVRGCARLVDIHLMGHAYAKAAIDIALWDATAKSVGLPLHALLGGAIRTRIPSYYAIGLMSPADTAKTVHDKIAQGFPALQLKVGCGDIAQDEACIRAAYNALTQGVTLAVDANRALRVDQAMHLSNALSDLAIVFEQPCATRAELRTLATKIAHPIYWDESTETVVDVVDALAFGHAQGLGMKLTRVGGVSAMLAVRDIAQAKGVPISVDDSWGGDVIAAACVHLGATVEPTLFRGTWLAQPYINHSYDPNNSISIDHGWIDVPQGPGLGVSPDPALFDAPVLELSV